MSDIEHRLATCGFGALGGQAVDVLTSACAREATLEPDKESVISGALTARKHRGHLVRSVSNIIQVEPGAKTRRTSSSSR